MTDTYLGFASLAVIAISLTFWFRAMRQVAIPESRGLYVAFCNRDGTLKDDSILYKYADDDYLLMPADINHDAYFEALQEQLEVADVSIVECSDSLVGISLQGRIHMRDLECPFIHGEKLVNKLKEQIPDVVIDFHAEATSEKIAFGWYMDGKASAVIGTHTHVQTADNRVLPQGTAYITDAGMTGPHDSVIGAQKEPAIRRFLTQLPVRFEPATNDVRLCGVILDVDETSGKAREIQRLMLALPPEV